MTEGIRTTDHQKLSIESPVPDNPSVSLRLTAPLHRGALWESQVPYGWSVPQAKMMHSRPLLPSLMIRLMTFCSTSKGISAASAVMKSMVLTARSATA